ncbi:MAG: hypothetical protein ACOC2F_06880 [Bacteroidota bacterium]
MMFNHLGGEWPTSDELKKDFGESFEENVLNPLIYNEDYVPLTAEDLASDILNSGILLTNKHPFGLKPSGVKISIPIENDGANFEFLPVFRPSNYSDSGLPTTSNPGIFPERVLYFRRENTILFRFVVQYQITLPF